MSSSSPQGHRFFGAGMGPNMASLGNKPLLIRESALRPEERTKRSASILAILIDNEKFWPFSWLFSASGYYLKNSYQK
jgi:hypothetical protein